MVADLIPGFEQRHVEANGMVIRSPLGGSGPPLPPAAWPSPEHTVTWRKVARELAERFKSARPIAQIKLGHHRRTIAIVECCRR